MPYLASGIQSLPQELKDLIFDYAFALPSANQRVPITTDYKPPTHLSVDSTLRTKTAQHYYASSIFTFDDPSLGCAWLASISAPYSKVVQHVDLNPLIGDVGMGFGGEEVMPVCPQGGELMEIEQLVKEWADSLTPREGVLRVRMRFAVSPAEKMSMEE